MKDKRHRKFWVRCPKRKVEDDPELADIPLQDDLGIPVSLRTAIRRAPEEE
jgi:hypothetical protein